jgi:hypothetical protein
MPSPVDRYFKEVKDENPSYSDEQAWATAWSIYCKHKNPGSDHCKKPTSEYLKGKSAMLREFQDAIILRNVVAHFVEGSGADASKAEARSKQTTKLFEDMKALKKKVDNADPSAKKKFDGLYAKLFESGESAAKAAEKLVKKFDDAEGETASAVKLVHNALREWASNKQDHHKGSGEMAHKKLHQAEQTWAYATKIDDQIVMLSKAAKGEYD